MTSLNNTHHPVKQLNQLDEELSVMTLTTIIDAIDCVTALEVNVPVGDSPVRVLAAVSDTVPVCETVMKIQSAVKEACEKARRKNTAVDVRIHDIRP